MPLETAYWDGQPVLAKFAPSRVLLSTNNRQTFCRQVRLRMEPDTQQSAQPAVHADAATLQQLARAVSTSSVVLIRLMKSVPSGTDFNGVSIVAGNLDDVRLEAAHFRNAFLGVPVRNLVCRNCDFSYADLTYLYGDGDVTGSTFDGTLLNSSFVKEFKGYSGRDSSLGAKRP